MKSDEFIAAISSAWRDATRHAACLISCAVQQRYKHVRQKRGSLPCSHRTHARLRRVIRHERFITMPTRRRRYALPRVQR